MLTCAPTRYAINDPAVPDYMRDYTGAFSHALIYADGFFILEQSDGLYWLPLERDDYTSANLAELEGLLFTYIEECTHV